MSAKRTTLLIALGALAILILGGAAIYTVSQINKLKNFCVKFLKSGTKINFLGTTKTDITLVFEITNQSDVSATVAGYQIDVFVNASKVTSAYSEKPISLNPQGSSKIEVNVVFNPLQVAQVALNNLGNLLASDKSSVIIEVSGKLFGIKSSLLNLNEFPISYKTNLQELTTRSTGDDTNCK